MNDYLTVILVVALGVLAGVGLFEAVSLLWVALSAAAC